MVAVISPNKPKKMNKNTLQKKAFQYIKECNALKIYPSYLSVLRTMYETATDKKEWIKASILNELIIEEINS